MDIKTAEQMIREFDSNPNPNDEQLFMTTEALSWLIHERHSPKDMMYLGGIYYERKDFALARKYYEMAAEQDYEPAHSCLGYLYYYGRTGERDYEQAFLHFQKSMELGNSVSTYKVADMYKNGYYVQRDYAKYTGMIEALWKRVRKMQYLEDPVPEVAVRLAGIRAGQGKNEEAVSLYLQAKSYLAQRIEHHPFFGNFTIMKDLIHNLYRLIPVDRDNLDFYDLYEVQAQPCQVTFYDKGKPCQILAAAEGTDMVISFGGKCFRTVDDFMQKGMLDGELLSSRAGQFYDFEVTG